LPRAELAALAQELVDQRRLAVVDVRDDRDVSNLWLDFVIPELRLAPHPAQAP